MKNTIALFVCALAIATAVSCGDQSSGSSSSAFKIQPGDVSTITPNLTGKGTSFDVSFGGTPHQDLTDAYAIIFQKNINGIDYVGIAFGEDPKSNRKFKAYIYFPSNSLIGTFNNINASISVIDNGIKYIKKVPNQTISLNISESSGLYEIRSSDTISLTDGTNDKDLSFSATDPDINAYLVQ